MVGADGKKIKIDDNLGQLVLTFYQSIDRNIKGLEDYDSFLFYLMR